MLALYPFAVRFPVQSNKRIVTLLSCHHWHYRIDRNPNHRDGWCGLEVPLTRKLSEINSPKILFRFRFRIDINWTDDLSHSCPHRYFTPNFTFAFAFVTLKVINSEIILFRFGLVSVSLEVVASVPAVQPTLGKKSSP